MNRRNFIKRAGAAAATFSLGVPTLALPRAAAQQPPMRLPWHEFAYIGDPLMDERLLWFLGHTYERMGDIGEILDTADRIEAGNTRSWMEQFARTADRVRAIGDASLAARHPVSAGEAYLRACSYFLAACIYSESPDDDLMQHAVRASAETFEAALDLLGIPGAPVEIPYENSALPGYFFRSPIAAESAPILIAHQGMDASCEENLFLAEACIRRGYHCILFHHPGQGQALRLRNIIYRPDWENVIGPVIDFAIAQPGVDPDRIAVMGISFGGALVTRAAAFEHRMKVTIANPAVYSWWDFISQFIMGDNPQVHALFESDPAGFDAAIGQFLDASPSMYRWWFNSAMWKWGASSPHDLLTKLQDYDNHDLLDKITCTMLIMDGEGEEWAAGQAIRVYEGLQAPKDYMLFTAEDTGLMHCQTGAMAVATQRMFDWLDEHL